MKPFTIILLLCLSFGTAFSQLTGLRFISSPDAWVGNGTTRTILPSDGHTFMAFSTSNGVYFSAEDIRLYPQSIDWWNLELSSTNAQRLHSGLYLNATRAPFAPWNVPPTNGLEFSGNARGDNTLSGYFKVFQAAYGDGSTISAFAADFVQFEGGPASPSIRGQIRWNSDVPFGNFPPLDPHSPILPVPEPSTYGNWAVVAIGLGLAMRLKRGSATGMEAPVH